MSHHADVFEVEAAAEPGRQGAMVDVRVLTARQAAEHVAALRGETALGVLWSPHELRVESRTAIPLLARWLEQSLGVTFLRAAYFLENAYSGGGGKNVVNVALVDRCSGRVINGPTNRSIEDPYAGSEQLVIYLCQNLSIRWRVTPIRRRIDA